MLIHAAKCHVHGCLYSTVDVHIAAQIDRLQPSIYTPCCVETVHEITWVSGGRGWRFLFRAPGGIYLL